MLLIAVFVASFVMVTFSSSSYSGPVESGEGGEGGGGGNSYAQEYSVPMNVITTTPSTFEVTLEDEVQRRLNLLLDEGSLDIARLAVRDLRPHASRSLKAVRIFIEKSDADVNTATDDPHYVGSFVLGLDDSQSFLFNIAPTLSTLWHTGALSSAQLAESKELQITFVPYPWDFASTLPEDFALPFSCLTLDVPSQP